MRMVPDKYMMCPSGCPVPLPNQRAQQRAQPIP
jgi:hypothetical protein